MQSPADVRAMLRRQECGGGERIARELGVSKNTVKRYLRAGGWTPYTAPRRAKALDGLDAWLQEQFLRHRGGGGAAGTEG